MATYNGLVKSVPFEGLRHLERVSHLSTQLMMDFPNNFSLVYGLSNPMLDHIDGIIDVYFPLNEAVAVLTTYSGEMANKFKIQLPEDWTNSPTDSEGELLEQVRQIILDRVRYELD